MEMRQPHSIIGAACLACSVFAPAVQAEKPTVNVTLDTYIRAESDHLIQSSVAAFGGGIMELVHARTPVTVEGKTESVRQPRWSIIRNVLGWVD